MGNVSVIKTLVVPAVIALLIFMILTYILVPVFRRARDRYSQYAPLDSISTSTFSFGQRISNSISHMIAQPIWRRNNTDRVFDGLDGPDDRLSDDGEELASVDARTRRALAEHARESTNNTRRLSRDLEEGFRDDSDDEDDRRGQRR